MKTNSSKGAFLSLEQLKEIEWSDINETAGIEQCFCPVCHGLEQDGHWPNRCWLDAKITAIKGEKKKTKVNDEVPALTVLKEGNMDAESCVPLRDWYAGMALQGWISSLLPIDIDSYDEESEAFAEHQAAVAKTCLGYADAMIDQIGKL